MLDGTRQLFFRAPALPLALALLLAGCGSPFADAPPVGNSTFVSALAELHLAEARLRDGDRARPDTMRMRLPPALRDSILARHGMDARAFRTTLRYYVRHPEQYATLYARVVDTLSTEQEVLRFGRGPPPPEGRAFDAQPVPPAFRKHGEGEE